MRTLPRRAAVRCAALVIMTVPTVAGATWPARADLALVQNLKRDNEPLLPGAPTTVRVYVSGAKTRTDAGPVTMIFDTGAKTLTLLDRRTRTYTVQPYDAKPRLSARDVSVTVTNTRRRQTILGHPARLFRVRGKSLGVPVTAEIWAAEDIVRPVIATLFNGTDEGILAPIRGLPLRVRLVVSPSSGNEAAQLL